MKSNPCFIIAHRYVRGYTSYIKHYIENIIKFYETPLIIVVDNNSLHKEEVFDSLEKKSNIILLDNNTEHKFEQGAYLVGLNYILNNNLLHHYDYYVFTQDTYILKNKYDFDELEKNNVFACPISWGEGNQDLSMGLITPHLINLGLNDMNVEVNYNHHFVDSNSYTEDVINKILHCYCNCYIVSKTKIKELHGYVSKIKITTRYESELCERYFAWVLYKLNEYKNYQIDHNPYRLYECHGNLNLHSDFNHGYFAKHQQQKRETTLEL